MGQAQGRAGGFGVGTVGESGLGSWAGASVTEAFACCGPGAECLVRISYRNTCHLQIECKDFYHI